MQSFDILCFSHLRWNFVYQRPQHLMSRFAAAYRVFYIEEPEFIEEPELESAEPVLEVGHAGAVCVVNMRVRRQSAAFDQAKLLERLLREWQISNYVCWYYTPMALAFSGDLEPLAIIYDCMDELSAFKNAPAELPAQEERLLAEADLVLTGGRSLYEARVARRPDTHLFPSSVDAAHFKRGRRPLLEPPDQASIGRPRAGFFGVIDERLDIGLLDAAAQARPAIHFVFIGPVVKIDPAELPQHPNVHWLGMKDYAELPDYIAGWDVALLPFALNDSTRYISPTKIPEYLAAGRSVVSTPVRDVVRPYGEAGLVHIGAGLDAFLDGVDAALAGENPGWLSAVDALLDGNSWDATFSRMESLVKEAVNHAPGAAKFAPAIRGLRSNDAPASK